MCRHLLCMNYEKNVKTVRVEVMKNRHQKGGYTNLRKMAPTTVKFDFDVFLLRMRQNLFESLIGLNGSCANRYPLCSNGLLIMVEQLHD